jgi:hypothetical protein
MVMRGGRILGLFLATAVFLLQGGECISLFFADKPAHECCRKGNCSQKNPDPCCQVSSRTTVTHYQAKEKISLADLAALPVLPAWTTRISFVPVDPQLRYFTAEPSPPGRLGNLSLPLLV